MLVETQTQGTGDRFLPALVVGFVMRARLIGGRRHPFTSEPPPYIVEASNVSDLVVTDDVPYRSIHDELRAIGRRPPRVWLLWENSD